MTTTTKSEISHGDSVKISRPKLGWYWFRKRGLEDWHIVRVNGDARSPTVRDTWGVSLSWKDWPRGDWVAIPDRNKNESCSSIM